MNLRPVGEASILKQSKFRINCDKKVSVIISNLRKALALKPSESLYIFSNANFAPAPDQLVYDLYRNFGDNGALVIHYARTQAWG